MATMPPRSPTGQPAGPSSWFSSGPGQALLDSESESIRTALAERPGQTWLWLAPALQQGDWPGRGMQLEMERGGWKGPIRCALPLPLANESVATVVVQHTGRPGPAGVTLIAECARVLVPGGRLWLYALNPLSPYRWRWQGNGLTATEPMPWRRRLREAGLQPEAVSQGLGPRWRVEVSPRLQQGPGLRAAWLLGAEKRTLPLTPTRNRAALRLAEGVPAA
jgi:SAM-dependent methyltransferase